MPTTRRASKQTHLEDFAENQEEQGIAASKPSAPSSQASRSRRTSGTGKGEKESSSSKKRKPPNKPADTSQEPKRAKTGISSSRDQQAKLKTEASKPIIINRAPVLELWGATVAEFLFPKLSWPTCLSIGQSIATICAISKGRSIGLIEPPSPDKKKKKKKDPVESQLIKIMGFPMVIKNEAVIVNGKPKSASEANVKRKFGEENYDRVRQLFSTNLGSWKGAEKDLDKQAFHMYEEFRPTVAAGDKGWGRKGELNLELVERVVRKT